MVIKVVNIHHKEEFDVYIGRAGKGYYGEDAKWGNKFSKGTREENIANYEKYLLASPELMKALPELLGKRLGCCCKPSACHGDILNKHAEKEAVR